MNAGEWLDTVRIVACLAILGYSCLSDWRTRRAPNRLWYTLGGIGIILGACQLLMMGPSAGSRREGFILAWAIGFLFIFALMYGLYYLFRHFGLTGIGGADAKALMAIALMFPYYPEVHAGSLLLPLSDVSRTVFFGLAVFGNALALNLVVPLGFLAHNLLSVPPGEIASGPLLALTGYKVDAGSLQGRKVMLMHRYAEKGGALEIRRAFGGVEADDAVLKDLVRWKGEGLLPEKVWVTPKIPFLIPITLGFILAVAWGDILTAVIGFFLFG